MASFRSKINYNFKKILKNFHYFIIFLYKRYFLYPIIGLCEKIVLNSFFWINNYFIVKQFFKLFYYDFYKNHIKGFKKKIKVKYKKKYKKMKLFNLKIKARYKEKLKIKPKINKLILGFLKVNKLVNLKNKLVSLPLKKELLVKYLEKIVLVFILKALLKNKNWCFLKCKNIKLVGLI